jgi:hypothetical protein
VILKAIIGFFFLSESFYGRLFPNFKTLENDYFYTEEENWQQPKVFAFSIVSQLPKDAVFKYSSSYYHQVNGTLVSTNAAFNCER